MDLRQLECIIHRDKLLYHYTNTYVAIEHILFNKMLKFSKLKNTNDPFEYRNLSYRISYSDANIAQEAIENTSQINRIIKNSNIACFSVDHVPPREKDGSYCRDTFFKGYSKSRMWSQYADNHKGVCLVFSSMKLLRNINDSIDKDKFVMKNESVNYTNKVDSAKELITIRTSEIITKDYWSILGERSQELIFTKLIDYRDEQEYRIALIPKSRDDLSFDQDIFIDFNDSLIAIIVGDSFSDAYKINMINFAKQEKMNIFKISWLHDGPKLSYYYHHDLECCLDNIC